MFRKRVDKTENAARLSKLNFKIELRNKGSFEPFSSEDAAEDTDEHKAVNIEEQEIPILSDVPEDTFDDGTEISDLDPDADLQRDSQGSSSSTKFGNLLQHLPQLQSAQEIVLLKIYLMPTHLTQR